MLRIIILLLVVLGIGFVAYNQGTKNPAPKVVESSDKEEMTINEEVTSQAAVNNDLVVVLSNKGLTKVPSDVFTKTNIEKLDLSGNKLTGALPAEVRHLQNLKVLDLSNNKFTGVPAEIGQLKNLEVLNLSNNDLTGLPLEMGNLSKLKFLNLKGNDYSEYDLSLIKEKLPSINVIEVD